MMMDQHENTMLMSGWKPLGSSAGSAAAATSSLSSVVDDEGFRALVLVATILAVSRVPQGERIRPFSYVHGTRP